MGIGGSHGIAPEDLSVLRLDPDTMLFKSRKDKDASYILTQKDSPFANFCLLAESIVKTRDSLIRTYDPRPEPSDSDDDDIATELFSESSDAEPPVEPKQTRRADEESGLMASEDHTTILNGQRIESHGGELDPSMRRRTNTSPPPRPGDEQWVVSVDREGEVKHRNPPKSFIPGAFDRSTLLRLMPSALDGEGAEEQEFCCINSIEMWNAYSVYISIRSVDMGLIRAIDNGDLDLSTNSMTSTQSPADAMRDKINDWRAGYADHIMSYNAATDLFIAKVTDHLGREASRGDADAKGILGLVHALSKYRAVTIPTDPRVDNGDTR